MTTIPDIKRVLISDEVDNRCIEILKSYGIEAVKQTKMTKDQLKSEIKKYDGLIVRSATKVTADVIEEASQLKVIGRAGTGIDNIDLVAATRRGIIVMNTPGGNTLSAAEHTCALLMAVTRNVSQGTASVRAGQWDQKKLMGNELYGKTLAIIGLGRIGREVAHRMQSFGMKTIGFDPLVSAEESRQFGIEWYHLDDLWPKADYITLHTPLIPQTKHLVNANTLAKCRNGVRIVNCARGGIVDENDLLEALKSGKCAGAGLDVFEQEPPTNSELLEHPLVTSTPHLGAATVEAQCKVAVEIAQNLVDFVCQKALVGAINADALSLAMKTETRPWLRLANSLAKIARLLLGSAVTADSKIAVITRGDLLKSAGSSLSAASLIELLSNDAGASIKSPETVTLNLVNAPALAKSAGIEVQTTHEAGDVSTKATMTLSIVLQSRGGASKQLRNGSDQQLQPLNSVSLTGTVTDNQLFWTAIDGANFWQPVPLSGSMVICRCCGSTKAVGCLSAVNEYISSLKVSDLDLVSFTATVATLNDEVVWGSMRLSKAIERIPLPSSCITFVLVNF